MTDNEGLSQALAHGIPLWEPERRLAQISQEEVRFSRGFLRCNPVTFVEGFAECWLPLLLSLETEVSFAGCDASLGSPKETAFQSYALVDDELVTIGFCQSTVEVITAHILPNLGQQTNEVLLEYMARRFVGCLKRSLTAERLSALRFVSHLPRGADEPIACVSLRFSVGGRNCEVVLGVGNRVVEAIDAAWRAHITRQTITRGIQYSDQLHTVSIELAELAVEPAVLIDYVRSGTVIHLETPVSAPVLIRLNEVPWFWGVLTVFRGCFAVKVDTPADKQSSIDDSKTRVRVELARFQLDQEGVLENQQVGAILATRVAASATANLIIGGEQVARASINESDGLFSLTVLPK